MEAIKNASIIIVDDSTHLIWPAQRMVYPRLSHDFQGDEQARMLGVRWALYSGSHHLLPIKLIESKQITPESSVAALKDLSEYLQVPMVRIAYGPDNEAVTSDWEVLSSGNSYRATVWAEGHGMDHQKITDDLAVALLKAAETAPPRIGSPETILNFDDQPHWCSWLVPENFIDFILDNHKDLVVLGKESSVPYLKESAAAKGVRVRYRLDLVVPEDCDCVVQTGSWGRPVTDKPIFQVMAAGWEPGPAANLPPELQSICPPSHKLG